VRQPRQQVNLYQHTAPAWRPFGSATLTLAAGAVACGLAAIWAFGSWQVAGLQRSVDALQRRQAAQQATLTALGSLQSDGAAPVDLQARIQQLSTELAAREHALSLLQSGAVGSTNGFSAQLAALARHPMTGLWLRQITVSDLSGSMSLAGEAIDPDRVPRYLRALATEHVLAGLQFDRLVIERPETPPTASAAAHSRAHPTTFEFHADGPAMPAQLAAAQAPQT
jgi:Tfp pilus assembly protein PilN